jgi:hypothetical protein
MFVSCHQRWLETHGLQLFRPNGIGKTQEISVAGQSLGHRMTSVLEQREDSHDWRASAAMTGSGEVWPGSPAYFRLLLG